MTRHSGRAPDELRRVSFVRRHARHAEGSVLVEFGDTQVLCTASVEDTVPPFLRGQGPGLDHRRVRPCCARHAYAHGARGGPRPGRPDAPRRSSASSAARCERSRT